MCAKLDMHTFISYALLCAKVINPMSIAYFSTQISPAAKIKTPHKNTDIQTKIYIGSDDVTIFLDAISGHRLETAFLLALYYGLRREEILGLKWNAIHEDGKLYIQHTVSRVKSTIAKDRTKTDASQRNYPIPDKIRDKLSKIRDKIFFRTKIKIA